MQKAILLLLALYCSNLVFGQNDFIVFKKHNRVIENLVSGDNINFQASNKKWYTGRIKSIKGDSLYLHVYMLVRSIDYFGLLRMDTSWMFTMPFCYRDIIAFPKQKESFSYIRNGFLLQVGSAGYAGLNVINTLGTKQPLFDKKNSKKLSIAAGVFALGEILHLTYKPYTIIGKKYSLEYVGMGK